MKKVLGIIQCRMSSERYPGKTMAVLADRPVLEWVMMRMKKSTRLNRLIIATTSGSEDDVIVDLGNRFGIPVVRGDKDNLLLRYAVAVKKYPADIIIRITADNPLTDPETMDRQIEYFIANECDYSNTLDIPYGTGVDIYDTNKLLSVAKIAVDSKHKEHICTYFIDHPGKFKLGALTLDKKERRPDVRVTLDTVKDHERLNKMFGMLKDPVNAGLAEIIKAYDKLPCEYKC